MNSLKDNPLVAQRLLFAGLLGALALSALLLWLLRSGAGRGGSSPRVGAVEAHTDGPWAASDPAAHGPAASEPEREALDAPPAPAAEAGAGTAEEGFDASAVYGRVRCADEGVANAELWLFTGELERRERRPPLASTHSDESGRFRWRGLEPHGRYSVQVQHEDFRPDSFTLFAGHAEDLELERTVRVSGRVLSASSGQAVAGVQVALEATHWEDDGLTALVRAPSDEQGRWSLPWVRPGMQEFLILRPGFLPERREFQVAEEGGDGFDILLADNLALELEVVSLASGVPLADTELLCDDRPVRTDARGRCALPFPAGGFADDWLSLALALPGGVVTQGRVNVGTTHGVFRIPVTEGGTVQGRVRDAAGAPVAGAELRFAGGGRQPPGLVMPEGFWLNPARLTARSDADGRFTLGGLPPREAEVEVRARHPDHPSGRSEPFLFTRLGQVAEVEIELAAGATLSGHVTLDGEPAALRVFWSAARGEGWTRANDGGRYRLAGLPSGEVQVAARPDDEERDIPRSEDQTLWLEEGQSLTCDLALASNRAPIRGRVIDSQGAPIAAAELSARVEQVDEDEESSFEAQAESESDGSFELSVPALLGRRFTVVAESGPRTKEIEGVLPGTESLELVLPALARLELRVSDALKHTPVEGFQLFWRESETGRFQRLVQGGRRFSGGPDGLFLAELPVGRLDLVVTARPQGYAPAAHAGLELFAGSTGHLELALEQGVELELEFVPPPDTEAPNAAQNDGQKTAQEAMAQLQRARFWIASEEQWQDRERGGEFYQQAVRNAQAVRADEHGLARVKALPSGNYRFVNGPRGYELRPAHFELLPVANQRVQVALVPSVKNAKNAKK